LTRAAILFSLPSFTRNLPPGLQKILATDGMRLGPDLQGGMNLILKVNLSQAVQSQLEQSLTDFRAALKERNISAGPVGAAADQVAAALIQELPDKGFVVESKAEIGASVSKELKHAALIAIAISLAGIIGYLGWRFDLRFGIAAAFATFHDVLTVLGIFYLLNKEITLLVVTALLTLAGYSLTDTVVVFDRIRENLRRKGKPDLGQVIN
jgi:preprotein translocase SecF subunit